jgi:hypothetical protein
VRSKLRVGSVEDLGKINQVFRGFELRVFYLGFFYFGLFVSQITVISGFL